MANGSIEFFSVSLWRKVRFQFVSPNDAPPFITEGNPHYQRPAKTLYLLHGYSGNSSDRLMGSRVADYAAKYNVNVILPDGENGFYLDQPGTGNKYASFVGEELVRYTRRLFHLSERREDTYVGGLSMGGFGALHTALSYPETFGGAFSLSGALIIHNVKTMTPGFSDMQADYDYYLRTFGEPSQVVESVNNPETLVRAIRENGQPMPRIYLAIGTEDFLYGENQIFRRFLEEQKVDFTYEEGPGVHDFDFWDPYCNRAMDWMVKDDA